MRRLKPVMKHTAKKRRPTTGYSVRLGEALEQRLDNAATLSGIDKSDIIRGAVRLFLETSSKTGVIAFPFIENDTPKKGTPPTSIVKENRANAG